MHCELCAVTIFGRTLRTNTCALVLEADAIVFGGGEGCRMDE